MARSLPGLVAYRALQGFGAGALQPTQQAILRQAFPPKEQGMAMAMFAMVIMVAPAVGPTLGGYIVDHLFWARAESRIGKMSMSNWDPTSDHN